MLKQKEIVVPSPGVDHLSDETKLANSSRELINVDITKNGNIRRRTGFRQRSSTPLLHSVYYYKRLDALFVMRGSTLCEWDKTTDVFTPVIHMSSNHPVRYVEYNGNLYAASKTSFGWLPNDAESTSEFRPVGVPVPGVPTLSATGNGALPAGKYAVAMTFIDDRGEESGTSPVSFVTLPSQGGIEVSSLATPSPFFKIAIYVTSPDGEELRHVDDIPTIYSSYQITQLPDGEVMNTQHLTPMIPGEFVSWMNGRLYTARGNSLYFSDPMRPHAYNPVNNVIIFVGDIRLMEPTSDGLYVADDRGVWFLSGEDPSKFELQLVTESKAVHGSATRVPADHLPEGSETTQMDAPMWLTANGYVAGMPGGEVIRLNHSRVYLDPDINGYSAFVIKNGCKQVVTLVDSTDTMANGTAVDSTPT